MPLLKWLKNITEGLFITAERPVFIVVTHLDNEDFSNSLCHLLAILGADVVNIKGASDLDICSYRYCDGLFTSELFSNKITVTFTKNTPENCKKLYKKRFTLSALNCMGRIRKV